MSALYIGRLGVLCVLVCRSTVSTRPHLCLLLCSCWAQHAVLCGSAWLHAAFCAPACLGAFSWVAVGEPSAAAAVAANTTLHAASHDLLALGRRCPPFRVQNITLSNNTLSWCCDVREGEYCVCGCQFLWFYTFSDQGNVMSAMTASGKHAGMLCVWWTLCCACQAKGKMKCHVQCHGVDVG